MDLLAAFLAIGPGFIGGLHVYRSCGGQRSGRLAAPARKDGRPLHCAPIRALHSDAFALLATI